MVLIEAGRARPQSGTRRRRDALRALVADAGLDALLVTDRVNVRYLTGFTGSNAALLLLSGAASTEDPDTADPDTADPDTADPDTATLATDGRYTVQAAAEAPGLAVLVARVCGPALLAAGPSGPMIGRVGFDSAQVTVDAHEALAGAAPDADLVRAAGLVERLRAVKDAGEIDALCLACAAADAALADALADGVLAPGRTERDVARELESRMRDHGAEGPSFETIVASGANAAIPHHRPTDAPLAAGDFLTMDFGALVDGYRSDMTRTVLLGPAADWQREIYDVVDAAAAAGRAALRPGVAARDVDAAARDVVAAAGYAEAFVHGLGHGVGLVIHEAPAVATTATATLEEGMTVTVEPGIYLPGRGGVRIEDTLVVRDDGAEPLTTSQRDLLVLDGHGRRLT